MKKIGIFLVMLLVCTIVSVNALSYENEYKDLNTFNFKEKFSENEIRNIKMICSYEFCDYIRSESINTAMNIFTNRYINTIQDQDIKNSLKVKGIKITKVIMKE